MRTATPNILLVVADQHRPDWTTRTSTLPLRMPWLEQVGDWGVQVTGAVTPSPLCAPARACLATARAYPACGVRNNDEDLPLDIPTYLQVLRGAGYHVAGTGKFDLHKSSMHWGLDGSRLLQAWGLSAGMDVEGKFDAIRSGWPEPAGPYMKFLHDEGLAELHVNDFKARRSYRDTQVTPIREDAYEDNWIAANALRLLRDAPRDQPWHFVVNFAGPHNPMDVTERMRRRWQDVVFPLPCEESEWEPAVHVEIRRRYAAMIENIDAHVGELISLIECRGELDDTVIIYTSDHGEMLGDFGLWQKSVPFEPSIGVPLIIGSRGWGTTGRVSPALVSLEDIAATILDLAGVSLADGMSGLSLSHIVAGDDNHRQTVHSGLDMGAAPGAARSTVIDRRRDAMLEGSWRAAMDATWKLVAAADATVLVRRCDDGLVAEGTGALSHPEGARLATSLQTWLGGSADFRWVR